MDPIVEAYLKKHEIQYVYHTHPAVFTCEEARIHCKHVPGLACKNLLLRDKDNKGSTRGFYLVIMPAEKRLQMSLLQQKFGAKKLRFAKPEELMELMKLEPGSVSPMGLINDKEHQIIVLIDQEIWNAEIVSFHPNVNTASLEMKKEMFHKLMATFQNERSVINIQV
ncbi:TPA: prolyl-tRNA synthetase associated domain-containing protein [Candidatus Woesearchaeota archaeon]|nr:prolyl-tRNA synthetase associated domain-containing protein [Candidatus Woesearchaeota archaeon]HIH47777.1 prolyl-tRNA synthetase associated domain-containing protein [Candidatus Woesearchaeota archaeon]HII88202.1 prolyl-tRNA synthetase associated domain-containing protein [Candidatus Woesearchaeota archaeon]